MQTAKTIRSMVVHFKHREQLYLASKSARVSSLLDYSVIANAFRKRIATLPSSAAVERLFSAAAQVLTSRRCRMTDDTLDRLLFLRSVRKLEKMLTVS